MSESEGPLVDADGVIADLRELERLTGGRAGARRVAWTEEWRRAREFLAGLLSELGLQAQRDEAGNLWAWLEGEDAPAVALGSHLDSVPSGGWLDGALGVFAALGVMRAWVRAKRRPPQTLALVDWADEEGARFGHSLFGSSAFAGTLDVQTVAELRDRSGQRLADAVAVYGVDLARALEAGRRRGRLGCYLELHIEQGPVLERLGVPVAGVRGCVGVERHRVRFTGHTGHAGTTPMDARRDAGLAAAAAALAVEGVGSGAGGTATTGALALEPGIATAVPGHAELLVDLRHADRDRLQDMWSRALKAARAAGAERRCEVQAEPIWGIDPIDFDPRLVALAQEACRTAAGSEVVLRSGALHDAAQAARVLPVVMLFAPSIAGVSHAPPEDTSEADLRVAIEAFGQLCHGVMASRRFATAGTAS
jgi:hydantoinase/carbamoylase family amidase